ncbi:unnamed protein product [Amoebophrya sp. A120]|nr:unnamed protein product [Amoebophrya sp. A120]|eukprot:GSA120T00015027001.1
MSSWLNSLLFRYTFPNAQEVEEVRDLAEGGFAFVSLCRDPKTGDQYALKKMICQDKKKLDLANKEVAILAALPEHKNIVRFYQSALIELAASGGGPVKKEIVMLLELCDGGTLLDWILKRGPQKRVEADILKPLQDVSEAVFLLHSHKPPVVHQDLKVENILLGSDGNWKLCDFGSWTSERIDLTNATRQEIMRRQDHYEEHVTMMYRPPEMADLYQKHILHLPIDQWQVGCILYTLMFYKQPFQDCTAPLAIAHAGYELPPDYIPGDTYSENLETVLHWLLARNPESRLTSRNLVRILWEWEGNPCLDPTEDANTLVVSPPMDVLQQKREKRKKCVDKAQQLSGAVYNPVAVMNLVETTSASSPASPGRGKTSGDDVAGNSTTMSSSILTNLGIATRGAEKLRGVAAGRDGVVAPTPSALSPRSQEKSQSGAATGTASAFPSSSSAGTTTKDPAKEGGAADEMQRFRTKAVGPATATEQETLAKNSAKGRGKRFKGEDDLREDNSEPSSAPAVDLLAYIKDESTPDSKPYPARGGGTRSGAGAGSTGCISNSKESWVADFGQQGPTDTKNATTSPEDLLVAPSVGGAASSSSSTAPGGSAGAAVDDFLFDGFNIPAGDHQARAATEPSDRRLKRHLQAGTGDGGDLFSGGGGASSSSSIRMPPSEITEGLFNPSNNSGAVASTHREGPSSSRSTAGGAVVVPPAPPRRNFDALHHVDSVLAAESADRAGREANLFADLEPPIRGVSPSPIRGADDHASGAAPSLIQHLDGGAAQTTDTALASSRPAPPASHGGSVHFASTGKNSMSNKNFLPNQRSTSDSASLPKTGDATSGTSPSASALPAELRPSLSKRDPFQVDFFSSAATTNGQRDRDKLFDDIDIFK